MDEEIFIHDTEEDFTEQNDTSSNIIYPTKEQAYLARRLLAKKRKKVDKTFKTILENISLSTTLLNVRQYSFNASALNSIGLKLSITKRFGQPLNKYSTPYLLFHSAPVTINSTTGIAYSQANLQPGLLFYPWHDNFLKLSTSPYSITNHERWNYNYTVENRLILDIYSLIVYLGFRVEHYTTEFGTKTLLYVKTNYSTESTIDISSSNIKYVSVISENLYDTVIDELDYEDISVSGSPLYPDQKFAPRFYYDAGSKISDSISTKIPKLYGEIADQTISISGTSRTYSIVSLVQFIPNNNIDSSVPFTVDSVGDKTYIINIPKVQASTENNLYNFSFFVDERPFLNLMNNVASTDNFLVPQEWIPSNLFVYSDAHSFNSSYCTIKNGIITINGKEYNHPVFIYKINKNYTSFYTEVVPYKQRSFGKGGDYEEFISDDISLSLASSFNPGNFMDVGGFGTSTSPWPNTTGNVLFSTSRFSFVQNNFKLSFLKNLGDGTTESSFEDLVNVSDKFWLRWCARSTINIQITLVNCTFPTGYTTFINNPIYFFTGSVPVSYVAIDNTGGGSALSGIMASFFMVPASFTLIAYLQITDLSSNQRANFKLGEALLNNQNSEMCGPCDLYFKVERNPLDSTQAKLLIFNDLTSYAIDTGFVFNGLSPNWTGVITRRTIINTRGVSMTTPASSLKYSTITDFVPTDIQNVRITRYIPVPRSVDKYLIYSQFDRLDISSFYTSVSELYRYYPISANETDIISSGNLVGHSWEEWSGFRKEYFPYNTSKTDKFCIFIPDYLTSMAIRMPWLYNDSANKRGKCYVVLIPKLANSSNYSYIKRIIDIDNIISNTSGIYLNLDIESEIDILTSIGCVVISIVAIVDTEISGLITVPNSGNEPIRSSMPWYEVFWQEGGVLVSAINAIPLRGFQLIVTPDGFLCDGEILTPIGPKFKNGIILGSLIVSDCSFLLPKHNPFVETMINRFPIGRAPGYGSYQFPASPNSFIDIGSSILPYRKSDGVAAHKTMYGIFSNTTYMGAVTSSTVPCSAQMCPLDLNFSGPASMFYDVFIAWNSTGDSQDAQVDEYLRRFCFYGSCNYGNSIGTVTTPFSSYTGWFWGSSTENNKFMTGSTSSEPIDKTVVGSYDFSKFIFRTLITNSSLPYGDYNSSTDLANTVAMSNISTTSGAPFFLSFQFVSLFKSRLRALVKPVTSSGATGRSLIIGKFNLGSGTAVEEIPVIGETLKGFSDEVYGSSKHLTDGFSSRLRVKVLSFQLVKLHDAISSYQGNFTQFVIPTSRPIILQGFNRGTTMGYKEGIWAGTYSSNSGSRPFICFQGAPPVPLGLYYKASPSVVSTHLSSATSTSILHANGFSAFKNYRNQLNINPAQHLSSNNKMAEVPIYCKTTQGYSTSSSTTSGIYIDSYLSTTADGTYNSSVV